MGGLEKVLCYGPRKCSSSVIRLFFVLDLVWKVPQKKVLVELERFLVELKRLYKRVVAPRATKWYLFLLMQGWPKAAR